MMPDATPSSRTSRRRLLRVAGNLLTLAAVVVWIVVLRPQTLAGPATYVLVAGDSMEPGLHTGDLGVVVRRSSYAAGDVVAYRVPEGDPGAGTLVIHRITGGTGTQGYVLRGDNRDTEDIWRPKGTDVVGRLLFSVPRVGYTMVYLRTPLGMALFAAFVTVLLVLAGGRRLAGSASPADPVAEPIAAPPRPRLAPPDPPPQWYLDALTPDDGAERGRRALVSAGAGRPSGAAAP